MEIVYREETLPDIKRRMILRGFIALFISFAFASAYYYGVAWYLSLAPSLVSIIFAFGDFFGTKTMEAQRKAIKIYTSDSGISIYTKVNRSPITWNWQQISIKKEIAKRGKLQSFTINTGNRYVKTFTFTDELTSFSNLYKEVYERTNV